MWFEIGDAAAREKVGQQLRESIARLNPHKIEARKRTRREQSKRRKSNASSGHSTSGSSATSASTGASLPTHVNRSAYQGTDYLLDLELTSDENSVSSSEALECAEFFDMEFFALPPALHAQISQCSEILLH